MEKWGVWEGFPHSYTPRSNKKTNLEVTSCQTNQIKIRLPMRDKRKPGCSTLRVKNIAKKSAKQAKKSVEDLQKIIEETEVEESAE